MIKKRTAITKALATDPDKYAVAERSRHKKYYASHQKCLI